MGETIEDNDKESEYKDNEINFFADKIGSLDDQFLQEMEQVNPIEDRQIKKLGITVETHAAVNY